MACSVIRLAMENDDRELRRDSGFGVATGAGRRLQDGQARKWELSGPAYQPIQVAGGRFPVRRAEVARAGAEPEDKFPLGTTCPGREEGHAVPERPAIHRQRRRRESAILWAWWR